MLGHYIHPATLQRWMQEYINCVSKSCKPKPRLSLCSLLLTVFVLFLATQPVASDRDACLNRLEDKTMVFISGFPQSGTSLLNALLTDAPGTSSMVKACDARYGKKCQNWNYEGQWMFENDGVNNENAIKLLQPGKQCPRYGDSFNESFASLAMNDIRRQWCQFWNLAMPILVEKSPQSMLKIPLIESTFALAFKTKFIIVIKHPVTLNTAVSRGTTWLTHTHTKFDSGSIIKTEEDSNVEQINENLRYFTNFLLGNSYSSPSENSSSKNNCSNLGWIPALEMLQHQLHTGLANSEIRIVRFEDFDRPQVLCKALLKFIYQGETNIITSLYKEAQKKVCEKQFPDVRSASTLSSQVRDQRAKWKPWHAIDQPHSQQRRQLRLKSGDSQSHRKKRKIINPAPTSNTNTVTTSSSSPKLFRHGIIAESITLRLKCFAAAFKQGSNATEKEFLLSLDARLLPFGYSLKDSARNIFRRRATVLDVWDLMKQEIV